MRERLSAANSACGLLADTPNAGPGPLVDGQGGAGAGLAALRALHALEVELAQLSVSRGLGAPQPSTCSSCSFKTTKHHPKTPKLKFQRCVAGLPLQKLQIECSYNLRRLIPCSAAHVMSPSASSRSLRLPSLPIAGH